MRLDLYKVCLYEVRCCLKVKEVSAQVEIAGLYTWWH